MEQSISLSAMMKGLRQFWIIGHVLVWGWSPAASASQAYLSLVEPEPSPGAGDAVLAHYKETQTDDALAKAVQVLIRARKSGEAWDLIEAHGARSSQRYFEAKLATVNARIAQVASVRKLRWARRLRETCTTRVEIAPEDEAALECLTKFHHRAPSIAGGDDAMSVASLNQLKQLNPARGALVEAEIVFSDNAAKGRSLVDEALSYDDVYDEGLLQAAMVYGYFKDWDAAAAALARIEETSLLAGMRHYQLGKLSAQLASRLDEGEAALMAFLQGETHYYGVDFRGPAHWRLGQIFRHGNRYDLAKLAFERALMHSPRLSAAKRDLKDIKKRIKAARP